MYFLKFLSLNQKYISYSTCLKIMTKPPLGTMPHLLTFSLRDQTCFFFFFFYTSSHNELPMWCSDYTSFRQNLCLKLNYDFFIIENWIMILICLVKWNTKQRGGLTLIIQTWMGGYGSSTTKLFIVRPCFPPK